MAVGWQVMVEGKEDEAIYKETDTPRDPVPGFQSLCIPVLGPRWSHRKPSPATALLGLLADSCSTSSRSSQFYLLLNDAINVMPTFPANLSSMRSGRLSVLFHFIPGAQLTTLKREASSQRPLLPI